jgi:hypothetical protein
LPAVSGLGPDKPTHVVLLSATTILANGRIGPVRPAARSEKGAAHVLIDGGSRLIGPLTLFVISAMALFAYDRFSKSNPYVEPVPQRL